MTADQGRTQYKNNTITAELTRYSSFDELKSNHNITTKKSISNDKKPSALEALHNLLKKESIIKGRVTLDSSSDGK